jgi:DNA topoisomerase-2
LYLFNAEKKLVQYSGPEAIIEDFFLVRLDLYEQRLHQRRRELKRLHRKFDNQVRFIQAVTSRQLDLMSIEDSELESELEQQGFARFGNDSDDDEMQVVDDDDLSLTSKESVGGSYSYLLNIPLSSLTKSHAERLRNQLKNAQEELETLERTSAEDLWRTDLTELEQKLMNNNKRKHLT